jgi:replicative DNA helicase
MIDSVSDPLPEAASGDAGTVVNPPAPGFGATDKPRRPKSDRRAPSAATSVDRLPQHSIEAEMGVLGCALLDPNQCIGECIEKLKDDGKMAFYDLRHQTIYETLSEMFNARAAIDLITVQQHLKDRQLLDQVGGMAYLSQLQDAVPSAANLGYYLDIVREKYVLRRLIQTCTGVVGKVFDFEGEVDTLLDDVEKEILQVNESRVQNGVVPINDLVHGAISTIENYFGRQGQLGGLATGFTDLDKMTDGLHGGEMIIIAARPSMGKTSLAMNIAEHVAMEQKLPVVVFSLEMSAASLILRMMCSLARVNLRSIREGFMSEADFPKLTNAAGRLSVSKLFIDDTAGLSILQLRARARRLAQQHGIKLFVIDYLQLLNSTARRAQENRQQEIADISSGIKALAKELNVPVIVLSQLNRELEKDKSRKPRLSDLRESGSIEQDADLVGLLYKPNAGDDEEDGAVADESAGLPVNLLIAKQRNGPTGDIHLTFLKPYTRFESASKVSDEDVPAGS